VADDLYSQLKQARRVAATGDSNVFGVEVGIVTNVKDPDKLGRVKVCFPRLPGKPESDWARVAQPAAGDGRGFYWIPQVSDEVLIGFERGQTHRPFVLGSLWNGKDKPMQSAYTDDNSTVMIQTKSGHQIVLSDKSGDETIVIADKSGKRTVTFDVKAKKFLIEAKEGDVEVHAKKKIVFACEDLEIKTSKTVKADIGSNFDLKVSSKANVQASSQMTLKGSTVTINPPGGAGGGGGGGAAGAAAGGAGGGAAGGGAGAKAGGTSGGAAAGGAPGGQSATVPTHDLAKPAAGGGAGAGAAAGGKTGVAAGGSAGAAAGGTSGGTSGGAAAQAGGGAAAGSASAGTTAAPGAAPSTTTSSGTTAAGTAAAPTKKPAIVSFTASQEAEPGEKADEFQDDISVPDDVDVVFKYEVTDADVVILSREGRELGQFNELKHEVPVRPPPQSVTTYSLTARNSLGERKKDFHVKSGVGLFDHVQITPEMTVWESEELEIADVQYLEVSSKASLKLNGVFEVSRVGGPKTLDDLIPLLLDKLKGAYSAIHAFLTMDTSNVKVEYEGSNFEVTPAADGSKYGGEIKYDWTFKITKEDFEMEGQGQLILLAVGKDFKPKNVKHHGGEFKVLQGAIEFSKFFSVNPEFAVKPGEILCKDLGVKAAVVIEFAPKWAKIGAQLIESTALEIGMLVGAVGGTVAMWLAFAYSVEVNSELGSLLPAATDLSTALWNAYWAGVTKPDDYYKTGSQLEEKALDEGKRRGKLFRDKLRQEFPKMSDAEFAEAAAEALPGMFEENEAAIRKDMVQNVFLPQGKVLIWKNYVEQYAVDLVLASEDQRRRNGWGALFGEFPREKGDMAALYHYEDKPGSENSMNVPWP
jgi:Type VI secretion system/phage-baseplate injector OB domain